MDLQLPETGGRSSGVYQALREAIVEGRLREGDKVPATRALAEQLCVSRNTVSCAYERLKAEGFLHARVGAGTFVARACGEVPGRAPARARLAPRRRWRPLEWPMGEPTAPSPRFDFAIGRPDPALFFWDEWRRALARQWRPRRPEPPYTFSAGHPRLRAAVARYLGIARGVRAGPEDLLITNGAQQALDLVGRVLLEPGDRAAIEEPGYGSARRLFEAQGAKVTAVRVDGEGLDVSRLPAQARLVYVTPSHQFPLGMAMSLQRRSQLLAWARQRRAAIIEDDYDSEFRFDGRPLEPLQRLDRAGSVIYVGSFSKLLLPNLRIGFLVAPAELMPALIFAKSLIDCYSPLEPQRALAELIEEGLLLRHARKVSRVYRARRDRLMAVLHRELDEELKVLPSSAGLHLTTLLHQRDAEEVVQRAQALGVGVRSLASFCAAPGRAEAGLVIGYGRIPSDEIEAGVRRLARAVRASAPQRAQRSR